MCPRRLKSLLHLPSCVYLPNCNTFPRSMPPAAHLPTNERPPASGSARNARGGRGGVQHITRPIATVLQLFSPSALLSTLRFLPEFQLRGKPRALYHACKFTSPRTVLRISSGIILLLGSSRDLDCCRSRSSDLSIGVYSNLNLRFFNHSSSCENGQGRGVQPQRRHHLAPPNNAPLSGISTRQYCQRRSRQPFPERKCPPRFAVINPAGKFSEYHPTAFL
ncbi:hypothetical protein FB451DRAFT_109448 [Mycena latifolia]|nr:hypothetical protein FB451DRAFT_109448 [Mycena latifolia]